MDSKFDKQIGHAFEVISRGDFLLVRHSIPKLRDVFPCCMVVEAVEIKIFSFEVLRNPIVIWVSGANAPIRSNAVFSMGVFDVALVIAQKRSDDFGLRFVVESFEINFLFHFVKSFLALIFEAPIFSLQEIEPSTTFFEKF